MKYSLAICLAFWGMTSCQTSNESPWNFVTKYFSECEIPMPIGDAKGHQEALTEITLAHKGEEMVRLNVNPRADYIYFQRFYFANPVIDGSPTFALITKDKYDPITESTGNSFELISNLDTTMRYYSAKCFDKILKEHPEFKTDLIEKPGARTTDMFPF